MVIPQDPIMLMSFVNTRLRDEYPSLQELCSSLSIDMDWLQHTLQAAGYEYSSEQNRFW